MESMEDSPAEEASENEEASSPTSTAMTGNTTEARLVLVPQNLAASHTQTSLS